MARKRALDKTDTIPENQSAMVLLPNGHWIPKTQGRKKTGEYRFCVSCGKVVWVNAAKLRSSNTRPRYCRSCWLKRNLEHDPDCKELLGNLMLESITNLETKLRDYDHYEPAEVYCEFQSNLAELISGWESKLSSEAHSRFWPAGAKFALSIVKLLLLMTDDSYEKALAEWEEQQKSKTSP